jgi:hypothetical protein
MSHGKGNMIAMLQTIWVKTWFIHSYWGPPWSTYIQFRGVRLKMGDFLKENTAAARHRRHGFMTQQRVFRRIKLEPQ